MGERIAAVMQPTYLPWLGYFDMIDQVDTFVYLDSVQFSPRSWQQRNRVKSPDGEMWLTVPVSSRGDLDKTIREAPIAEQEDFPEHHLKSIERFYRGAEHFDPYYEEFGDILQSNHQFVGSLNIDLIEWFCDQLGIDTDRRRSSKMDVSSGKVRRLLEICHEVEADTYLSAQGSRDYLSESDLFDEEEVNIIYHDYEHPTYRQKFGEFESHLSILDLLLNEGPESLEIIRSGRVA